MTIKYEYQQTYRKAHPWYISHCRAKSRCENPKNNRYYHYGARGIKCQITIGDVEYLWKRDGAREMKIPSIHRIDSSKNYTLDNCAFIEKTLNSSFAGKKKKGIKHRKGAKVRSRPKFPNGYNKKVIK